GPQSRSIKQYKRAHANRQAVSAIQATPVRSRFPYVLIRRERIVGIRDIGQQVQNPLDPSVPLPQRRARHSSAIRVEKPAAQFENHIPAMDRARRRQRKRYAAWWISNTRML